MGIRTKIMMGFIILASLLFISGAISIYEITKLGREVKGLVIDSYKSIDYSKNMLNALDEHKVAFLYFASGETTMATKKYTEANRYFERNLNFAISSFQLQEEQVLLDSVKLCYDRFKSIAEASLSDSLFRLQTYISQIEPSLSITGDHVKNLVIIYQDALYESTTYLENSAQRASMPGLIVIIISILFTVMFTYLVHHFFVLPIIRLTKGIDDYVKYRKPFDVPIETRDELYSLRESITHLMDPLYSSIKRKK